MRYVNWFALVMLFASCLQNNRDQSAPVAIVSQNQVDTNRQAAVPEMDLEMDSERNFLLWEVNLAKKTMKKNRSNPVANADSIISSLNAGYNNISIEKIILKEDTLFLNIKNRDSITRHASTGFYNQLLAQAVINLTAVPGIRYVFIASGPGINIVSRAYGRKDFPGFIIIQQ